MHISFVWNYSGHNGGFFDKGPNWIQFTFPPSRKRWRMSLIVTSDLFRPRYKKYAAWPVVIWCRLTGHRNQPRWDTIRRCLRCGDPDLLNLKYDKARRTIVSH